jgi:hypothetical protein
VKSSTKVFGIIGLILLFVAVVRVYEATTNPVILRVPVALQTGASITETFTVHRAGSYDLEIECETTPESIEAGNDLDDALADGLDVDARMTSEGQPIQFHSDPEHFRGGAGFYSRVLGTFEAVPRKSYNLTLHVIRYGQGISARDHKLAGTWDENLLIPEEAHPKLKIEIDPLIHETDGPTILLAGIVGLGCLMSPLTFWIRQMRKRVAAPI